jgi:hypothetical protein
MRTYTDGMIKIKIDPLIKGAIGIVLDNIDTINEILKIPIMISKYNKVMTSKFINAKTFEDLEKYIKTIADLVPEKRNLFLGKISESISLEEIDLIKHRYLNHFSTMYGVMNSLSAIYKEIINPSYNKTFKENIANLQDLIDFLIRFKILNFKQQSFATILVNRICTKFEDDRKIPKGSIDVSSIWNPKTTLGYSKFDEYYNWMQKTLIEQVEISNIAKKRKGASVSEETLPSNIFSTPTSLKDIWKQCV